MAFSILKVCRSIDCMLYAFISRVIDEDMVSATLEELVHHPDQESFPISKLRKIWESGVIKANILHQLKGLSMHKRTLEEAAR